MFKSKDTDKNFVKEEVVWAKVRGYPAWPAVVKKISEVRLDDGDTRTDITCTFIGDNTYSVLASDKIYKYEKHHKQFSNANKQKKLQTSIKQADQIHQGRLSYEDSTKMVSQKKGQTKSQKDSDSDDDSSSSSSSDGSVSSQDLKKLQQQRSNNSLIKKTIVKKSSQPSKNRRIQQGQMKRINIDSQSECSQTRNSSKMSIKPTDFGHIKDDIDENQWNSSKKSNSIYNDKSQSPRNTTTTMLTTNLQLQQKQLNKTETTRFSNSIELNVDNSIKQNDIKTNTNLYNLSNNQVQLKEAQIILEQTFQKILSILLGNNYMKTELCQTLDILIQQIHDFKQVERKQQKSKQKLTENPKYFANITEFLSNNTGINMNCIRDLIHDKKQQLQTQGVDTSKYIKELDSSINYLKSTLLSYYFDNSTQIEDLRNIRDSQPQKLKKELTKLAPKISKKQIHTTDEEDDASMSVEDNSSQSDYSIKNRRNQKRKLMKSSHQNIQSEQQQQQLQENDEIYHSEDEDDIKKQNQLNENINQQNIIKQQQTQNIQIQQNKINEDNNINSIEEEEDNTKQIQKNVVQNSLTSSPQTQTTASNNNNNANESCSQQHDSEKDSNTTQKLVSTQQKTESIQLSNKITTNPSNNVSSNTSNGIQNSQNSSMSNQQQSSNSANIANQQMRKKVCKKIMEKFIEVYGIEKKTAQEFVLSIEKYIRGVDPVMKKKYQDMVVIIMKIIKNKLLEKEAILALGSQQKINFSELETILKNANL